METLRRMIVLTYLDDAFEANVKSVEDILGFEYEHHARVCS